MSRMIVGIKFKVFNLTDAGIVEWLFDNVGECQTRRQDVIVCADHEKEVYISWAPAKALGRNEPRIRIGVAGDFEKVEQAWEKINNVAKNIVRDTLAYLEAEAHDLAEYDESVKGIVVRYDEQLPLGKVEELGVLVHTKGTLVKAPVKVGHA